ncbi:macro domain-containing protein [Schlesneria sp. T3-172]|uniref:macro domain-containing protein n=1 Tax=Schlesneria sphaerica TaxID=3373610 RepID=UPI0037C6B8A5
MKVQFGVCRVELQQGDISQQVVDAVVNAANPQLAGGGGVDGAIHRAAGPTVMAETQARFPLGCPPGDAVPSGPGLLPAKVILHAVGPVWRGGQKGEVDLLRSCIRRCLELAVKHSCSSIAFPAISTGAYRFPVDLAAENSLAEVRSFVTVQSSPMMVRFVLFDGGTYGAFARVLESYVAT